MKKLDKVGKYVIRGELGIGGMGLVFTAWDSVIQREVAIKAIKKSMFPEHELDGLMKRFRQEAQVVGKLMHPRVIQIYDYLEDEIGAYIVMELATGQTLADVIAAKAPLNLYQIERVMLQVLEGIGYAHAHGVIHRDMKPGNVFICAEGRVKIGDFGIAHIESSTLTRVGEILGTPYYMSPEQFTGETLDGLSDLFAIAVFLYEWLTGVRPFSGSVVEVMHQVLHKQPPKPSHLNPLISAEIEAVLYQALAKNPADRYPSAQAFAQAIQTAFHRSHAQNVFSDDSEFNHPQALQGLSDLPSADLASHHNYSPPTSCLSPPQRPKNPACSLWTTTCIF
jgi:eukaryotic-like serine/threonine-protein kinase